MCITRTSGKRILAPNFIEKIHAGISLFYVRRIYNIRIIVGHLISVLYNNKVLYFQLP